MKNYIYNLEGINIMDNRKFDKFIRKKVIGITAPYPIIIFGNGGSLTIECSWRLKKKPLSF